MVAFTCNAFGDIVAIVSILRMITIALKDSRQSRGEYRCFMDDLQRFADLLERVAKQESTVSAPDSLQEQVLAAVQRCCDVIQRAVDCVDGFKCLKEDTPLQTFSDRLKSGVLKVRWRVTKVSEVKVVRSELQEGCIGLIISLSMCVHRGLAAPVPDLDLAVYIGSMKQGVPRML